MKIVLVASLYAPYVIGGAERVVQSQAEALAARGHTVHVLTLGEPGSGTVRTWLNGVKVIRFGIRNIYLPGVSRPGTGRKVAWHMLDMYNPVMGHLARVEIASLRPDLVVCHNIFGWSAAVWHAVKSLDLPLVQVLHDQYLRCVRANMFVAQPCKSQCTSCHLMRLPHRRLSQQPDAVAGVSRYVLSSLLDAGYFSEVPIRTSIHNASPIDTRATGTPSRTETEVVFGFIGSLTRGKGIEALLDAFQTSAQPHWRLRVAGTGEPDFVARLRSEHADPRIEFLGRQDPASFYLDVDVTVIPSLLNEALGNVVFESLIHGRPVVGSRRGGIPEMIEDGVCGLLFDPAEDGALASALRSMASDIDLWRARNEAIKSLATPRYCDFDAWLDRWESLFRQAIERAKDRQ